MRDLDDYSADEVREARRPIASLVSKSEKAQQKLAAGTWQHTMLGENLAALHIAAALMADDPSKAEGAVSEPEDLSAALEALASMASRTESAQGKFAPGTSQHTLARNRLKALRIAEALIRAESDER